MSFESMPRQDLLLAIESLANEKMIDKEIVFESLEIAIAKIAKHKYGEEFNIVVDIDRKNGAIIVKRLFEVIESPESKGDDYNPNTMLTPKQAKKYKEDAQVGDVIEDILPEPEFGRMAFQTARQIMSMRVRDAEKGRQYEEFKDNIGDIVSCVVKRIEHGNVIVDINGRAEGYIKNTEMIPFQKVAIGDRIRALIMDVIRSNTGPQIILTRTHPLFMEKLFAQEVPEIYEGIIKIKSVARDPGSHAKIAVETQEPRIDAVGMTVGIKGTRIQPVINECYGEKIDVVLYSEDPAVFILNAMTPAKVEKIIVDEDTKKANVVIKEDPEQEFVFNQKSDDKEESGENGKNKKRDAKSIAIGRNGQNVKLASMLTGWEINVVDEKEEKERSEKERIEKTELFTNALKIDDAVAERLINDGFRSIEEIAYVDKSELDAIEGFSPEISTELQNRAKKYLEEQEKSYFEQGHANGIQDDLLNFTFVKRETIMELGKQGIKSLEDLADLASDELVEILGQDKMKMSLANRIIMKAREIAYGITEDDKE
ncbi:MAG: transcription termination factor NusA [Alphaproteobacteria bacterium]|nr:transcription termination factor NusA [Alphaproteobacteria bacterium]